MLNYSKKQIIIFSSSLTVLIIIMIVLIGINSSRAKDLRLVSQARSFATALENYYEFYHAYPATQEIDLAKVKFLTEQGINQPGDIIYYQSNGVWSRPTTWLSSNSSYVIKFSLKNSWPVWQLKSWWGGDCRINTNVVIVCDNG